MKRFASAFAFMSLATLSLAAPASQDVPHPLESRQACIGNTPSTRSEWCDYNIDTDYTTTAPDTGVVREYYFELTDITVSLDGNERPAMAINGSIPGPTIFADWGDTVVVHVTNSLTASTNGTSIHFHGIRQNFTNQNDGVASITQCPTPPGSAITYTWRALQYGSSWWHSHFALQAWQGVYGGIVINGPATTNYDEDMGVMILSDWTHQTADALYYDAQLNGPPTLDNGLINGTNVYGVNDEMGHRWNTTWKAGTSYRLRLVNAAIDTHFKFTIDNHTMTVIAADFVPVTPFTAQTISIGMGQRYDVVVTADQASTADNFWLRAFPQSACSDNDNADNVLGIISYTGSVDIPTTKVYDFIDNCEDMDASALVPHHRMTVGGATWTNTETATAGINSDRLFRWFLNSTTMLVEWANPTLLQVSRNETAPAFAASDAVLEVGREEWVYLAIDTTLAVSHPIHLHGHDFFVLAQGYGAYDAGRVALNLDNPPRRDTAVLNGSGYLVLAFRTDNPGAWLMHCHIGWHTTEGFGLQFVERREDMLDLIDTQALEGNCDAWRAHQEQVALKQDDSGI